ncbi:hypothetical protein EAO75_34015 [Streptomyces sp. uw30]|nr:hypothetical protein EAO75_34015 [Streptomyces sp. uw30]
MRSAATWFLAQKTLPPYGIVQGFDTDFRAFLDGLLIPRIEQLIGERPNDDGPTNGAMAGVGEARRRLHEPVAEGLNGEVARVKGLARSVVALCDHRDELAAYAATDGGRPAPA